jgi:DNA-binding response OmpR family regulator
MKKTRIFILDDDVSLTQSVKLNLEETGDYEVLVENDSTRALASAQSFLPDIVLLDYVMPGLDGGDITKSFRQSTILADVPIIMLTALVANSETGDAGIIERGGHSMVAKPVRLETLLRCIERTLGSARVA